MLVAQYDRHGAPDEVVTVEDHAPEPVGAGEVRCRLLAAPINPSDLLAIGGTYQTTRALPAIAGNEGVGRIVEISADVSVVAVGDRVMLPQWVGTWREEMVIPADNLVPLPAQGDPLQLSMMAINPPTALLLLEDFMTLEPGEWVVQNAANSAVGEYVIQLARLHDLRSCNIVRRAELEDYLYGRGADVVLLESEQLPAAIREATGGNARIAFDAVGGASTGRLAAALAQGGVVVSYGNAGREPCTVSPMDLIFRDIQLRGFWLSAWFQQADAAQRRKLMERLVDWVSRGELAARVDATYPVAEIETALRHAMRSGRNGKIVIVADPEQE